MPGTTYTASGPAGDPAGRLADFARFAVAELEELDRAVMEPEPKLGTPERIAAYHADEALEQLRAIARVLEGYTTADELEA